MKNYPTYKDYKDFLRNFARNYSDRYEQAVKRLKNEHSYDGYYEPPIRALNVIYKNHPLRKVENYGRHRVNWLNEYPGSMLAGYDVINTPDLYDAWEEKLYVLAYEETGGANGGDCWGSEAQEYSSESVLDQKSFLLVYVQAVFETLGIPFTEALMDKCKQKTQAYSCTKHEYYGNYVDYFVYRLSLKDIYDIVEMERWND